jgi:hypothetical protein
VIFVEQVMIGGSTSNNVMSKEQLSPEADTQVTVVVPTGNSEPEGGEHVTVPQSPTTVGGG